MKGTVVVFDDELAVGKLLRQIAKTAGWQAPECLTLDSVKEVLTNMHGAEWNVVFLCDCTLPDADEVTSFLWSCWQEDGSYCWEGQTFRVVRMSGSYSNQWDMNTHYSEVGEGLVGKPFAPADLRTLLLWFENGRTGRKPAFQDIPHRKLDLNHHRTPGTYRYAASGAVVDREGD